MFFYACQKEDVTTGSDDSLSGNKLTDKQVELLGVMDNAARVIAKITVDKEINDEIANMVALGMYNDDYIKFKDLFQPESNSKLKSTAATKFAKRFRDVVKSSSLKSSGGNGFDLEKYLIDNDLALYVPYPLEDYPENMRTPVVSFHPLTNDSVNIGYLCSNLKSINQVQQVDEVDEAYSQERPVYIIEPDDIIGDSGGGTGGGDVGDTGGGSSNKSRFNVKLVNMHVTKFYGGIFSGGPDINIVFADAIVIDAENNMAAVKKHFDSPIHFSRREVKKMKKDKNRWKDVNIVLDPEWKEDELVNYIGMVELDKLGTFTLGVKATVKVSDKVSLTPSISYTYKSTNDFVGERELPRDFFLASEKDHNLESGTYDGRVIRKMNADVMFTTEINYY